jgi:hypothetical protein
VKHLSILIIVGYLAFGPLTAVRGGSLGPIVIPNLAGNPFGAPNIGTTFFVDDFKDGVDYVTRHLEPLDIDYSLIKLKTPGAYSDAPFFSTGANGNELEGGSICTNSIPGTCSSGLDIFFDRDELGFLPQAVGIAVANSRLYVGDASGLYAGAPIGLYGYDTNDQPIDLVTASNTSQSAGYTFLGIINKTGIARIAIQSPGIATISEIQYGQIAPEPSSLLLVTGGLLAFLLTTKTNQPPSAHPCAGGW